MTTHIPPFPRALALQPRRVRSTVHGQHESCPLPFVVTAARSSEPLDAHLRAHRAETTRALHLHGAVRFRGFGVREAPAFLRAIEALEPEVLSYTERSSPRHEVSERVYTSTDHPRHQAIVLHSEQSYTLSWPRLICFFCQKKADGGGNTPLARTRDIVRHLPDSMRERFAQLGVLYQRTYTPGLGVSWQDAFQTEDRAVVERFCQGREIRFVWSADGRLKTWQRRPAFRVHPHTGEKLWFNHALFFHVTSLEPQVTEALIASVGLDNVPTNTFFGDGSPFTPDELAAMRQAVARETIVFDWQTGDVLVVDNMSCQHGREPFTGERTVLTLMACPTSDAM
jgi:alpha-ketoglutarate-dependent taurine dioxygenase